MSESRKCFTFIWKIKNFSFHFDTEKINSPSFVVRAMSEKFYIELYFNSKRFEDCITCYFHGSKYLNKFELELSFLDGDGSAVHTETYLKFIPGGVGPSLHVKRDEVFLHKKGLFIPDDTLTIRCRVWNEAISQSGRCVAETRFETEERSFVGTIEKLSCTHASSKARICIKPSSMETFFSSIYLTTFPDGKLDIEIKPIDSSQISMYRCKIYIQDIFGNKINSGEGDFFDTETHSIDLTIFKKYLIENRKYYLLNDMLTVEFVVIIRTGKTVEKIDEPEYGFDFQDTQEIISNATQTHLSSKAGSVTSLMEDLNLLLSERILYDTKLKTATETFPAHTIILSARSSVFKSMFTTDMKEKMNNCVEIDDLDADTVRRMLSFMYSDTLDDLVYESAKNLYFAADKYNIASLRSRCSDFLKQNLLQSNCCDVLLLSDKHQDEDLKNAAQDYIAKNDDAVLFSGEWEELGKNHPEMTLDTLRAVYMKNRRS